MKDLLEISEVERAQSPIHIRIPGQPKKRGPSLLVVSAVVAALLLGVVLVRKAGHAMPAAISGETQATVRRADFIRSIRINGTVEAVNFLAIAAPKLSGPGLGTLVITKLATTGGHIKKGDLLVQFDQQQQIKNALEQEATYVDFVEQINKKKADQAAALASDQSALHQAENDVNSAAFEVKRNEILSKIDAEKNDLAYEQAKATLAQLRKTFDLKRRAAQAELKSLEIQRDRARDAMDYARKNTGRLEIHAPIDGVVVLNTIWKGGQFGEVQEGDEVRAGVPFMQIVNPGAMQVRSRVNQADVSLLRVGQTVRVRLDAYPDLTFDGKVDRIAAIGVTSGLSDKVRSFNVLFSIAGYDPRLMPDLSASLDVELQHIPNALLVPRNSIESSGNNDYVLANDGSGYSRKAVRIEAENDIDAMVSGVKEGMRVLTGVSR